jgi:hypothetical protein
MGYRAAGFGPDDLRLGGEELLSMTTETDAELRFVSTNVTVLDPSFFPSTRIVDIGGRKIGITAALKPESVGKNLSSDISIADPLPGLEKAREEMKQAGCNYRILLWYGDGPSADALLEKIPEWNLVVLGDDPGEPEFQPSKAAHGEARFVRVGHKGMIVCLIGLYDDAQQPWRYARVPLTHEFEDSLEMTAIMAKYQESLQNFGLQRLGLDPIPHPSGRKFVGTEKCGECHTTAFSIWEKTPHAKATEDLVHPPNTRGSIARHFDPECLSCHATGWEPQKFVPFESGYLSLETTPQMVGNGCENCHGPGAEHVAAEEGAVAADDVRLAALRNAMRLPLAKAKAKCVECHDADNSPDFGKEGAFERYWSEVEHIGKD